MGRDFSFGSGVESVTLMRGVEAEVLLADDLAEDVVVGVVVEG